MREFNIIPLNRSKNSVSRLLRGIAARSLLAAVPLAIAPAAHAGYNLTYIPDPTGTGFINPLGINSSGTVAGFDNGTFNQGFTLTLPSTFSSPIFYPSTPPGSYPTMVTGINDAGDLSGIYVNPTTGVNNGFTDIGGVFTTVNNPASSVFNQALDINNSDETVGYYAPTVSGFPGDVAYSQTGGMFTDINALLPANVNSQAVGLNNAGWVVGFYQPTTTTSLGFVDDDGTITSIDPFGSSFVSVNGINDKGEIVGFYDNSAMTQLGFVGFPDGGGYNFISFAPNSEAVSTTINSLNDAGDIVGFYTNGVSDTVIGFVGSPVPEASTWAMMIAGFAGLGFLGYRKVRIGTQAA
jgi:hypothetical protein